MSLIQVQNLTKVYSGTSALSDVSFEADEGEWLAVMGPSGSGKTTLVNMLGALDTPTAGQVLFDGADVGRFSESESTRFRTEKIGFVFQQFHLVQYLTALENVMLSQYLHSMTDEQAARRALERVGLGHRLDHLPSQLSTGEQQRVVIARALINQARLILADEPTGNLDEHNEAVVMQLFHELHREGHTIIMVTHDPTIGRLANRRIELDHGRLSSITVYKDERDELIDHLLEEIWMLREGNQTPEVGKLLRSQILDVSGTLKKMEKGGFVRLDGDEVVFTPAGEDRARDVIRRYRLAERLFRDTFSLGVTEAESHACKFEHILSPEVTERICDFLGHPDSCPHGQPIPPGECCTEVVKPKIVPAG